MKGAVSAMLTKIYQQSRQRQAEESLRRETKRAQKLAQENNKFSKLAAQKGVTFFKGNQRLGSAEPKMASPVEAGFVKDFFRGIFIGERVKALTLKAEKSLKKERRSKPNTLLRQVNGVVYEYHLATVFPARAINEARSLIGLPALGPKTKYVRATHPLTKDGFKFVCNARRARFSMKKVRLGAPIKPFITKCGEDLVFSVVHNNVVKDVSIPLSTNKFEALTEVSEPSVRVNKNWFRIPSHVLRAEKEMKKQKALKRSHDRFVRRVIGYRRSLLEQEAKSMVRTVVRSPILAFKLRAIINSLKAQRIGQSPVQETLFEGGSTILGPSSPKGPIFGFEHQMAPSTAVKSLFKKPKGVFDRMKNSLIEKPISECFDAGIRAISDKVDELFSKVKSLIPPGVSMKDIRGILIFIVNIIQDFYESINRFIQNIGNNIIGILNCLGIIEGKVFYLSAAIANYFRCVCNKLCKPQGPSTVINIGSDQRCYTDIRSTPVVTSPPCPLEHQMGEDHDSMCAPIATLITALTALIGYKMSPNERVPNFFDLKNLRTFSMTANSLCTFVSNHLGQIVKLFEWCHAKMNKYMFSRIISEQPDDLKQFLRESSFLAFDPSMYEQILKSPVLQVKVFRLAIQAHKLSAAISCDSGKNALQLQVRQTIAQISKLQERLINDCITPNVGYEPWVLFLTGNPGVGKSTIVYKIVPELLKHINYNTINEMIFTRSIGSDYWNGCCGQPFTLFDDIFVEEESARKQLYEWMQLKSAVSFVPNCAHLEDKKRRYNPIGIILNGNKDYFDGSNLPFCYTPDAINRRRDMLWKVDLCDSATWSEPSIEKRQEILKKMESYRESNKKSTFEYYRFFKAINPRVKQAQGSQNYGPPMLFDQFLTELKENFKTYRMRELVAYEERMNFMCSADDSDSLLSADKADELISKRMNDYCESMINNTVGSSIRMIRNAVNAGVGTIYGKKLLEKNPLEVTIEEEIEALEEIDTLLKIHEKKKELVEKIVECNKVIRSSKKKEESKTKVSTVDTITFGDLEHQMDNSKDNEISTTVSIDQDSSVAVIDQGPIQDTMQQVSNNSELSTITLETDETFAHMAGHMYLHRTVEWSKTQDFDTVLINDDLPNSFFKTGEFKNSMNSSIFRGYRFYRFDIEVKVVINASKMNYGTLLTGWKYSQSDSDISRAYGMNCSQLIQAPHAFINASSNSVATFTIPYKFIWPMLNMQPNFDINSFCTFYVRVFNKLRSYDAASSKINVSMFFRFTNVYKSGLYYNLGIEHQMLSSIAVNMARKGVETLLRSLNADPNRDNPSDPQSSMSLVPVGSHSWAHGTNVIERLNILRLDPLGVTPHFDTTDEMSVSSITRIFGYVGTVTWKAQQNSSEVLCVMSVSPYEFAVDNDFIISHLDTTNRKLAVYRSTPLSVISSCFSYWRGDIEYRLDFINSFMMTGRIFICFIPNNKLSPAQLLWYNFEKCKSFYGTYFDLGEETSFTFKVPYITYCPMLHTEPLFEDCRSGFIKVFVVNQLCTGNVATEIDVNIFIRAGPNFELAIPSVPKMFPSYNNNYYVGSISYILNKGDNVLATNFTELSIQHSGRTFSIVALCSSDSKLIVIEPIEKLKFNKVYVASRSIVFPFDQLKSFDCDYFLLLRIKEKEPHYILAFDKIYGDLLYSRVSALVSYLEFTTFVSLGALFSDETFLKIIFIDSDNCIFVGYLNQFSTERMDGGKFSLMLVNHDITLYQHESDDRTEPSIIANSTISSNLNSMRLFNESFQDLKDLMRRYQFYGDFDFTALRGDPLGKVYARVPILPSGLFNNFSKKVDDREILMANQNRGGLIPLIASGFRFFRGSLRLKLVFTADVQTTPIVTFVHDRRTKTFIVKPESQGFLNMGVTGYAMYGQSTDVNPIIEIEIPYYKRSPYLWANKLGNYSADRHALGYLDITATVNKFKSSNISVQIYMALGDDARFTSFQGFPSVCRLETIPSAPTLSSLKVREKTDVDDEGFLILEHQMGSDLDTSDDEDSIYNDIVPCIHETIFKQDIANVVYQYFGKDSSYGQGEYLVLINIWKSREERCTPIQLKECKEACSLNKHLAYNDWIKKWIKHHFNYCDEIHLDSLPTSFISYIPYVYPNKPLVESTRMNEEEFITEEDVKSSKSFIQNIKSKCSKYFNWDVLKTIAKWLAIIAAIVGTIFVGKAIWQSEPIESASSTFLAVPVMHQTFKGDRKNLRVRQRKEARFSRSVFGKGKTTDTATLQHEIAGGYRDVVNLLKQNIYCCILSVDGHEEGKVKVTIVKDRLMVGIKHFFDKALRASNAGKKVEVILARPNLKYVFKLGDLKIIEAENSSLILCTLPKNFQQHRDITKHIVLDRELDYVSSSCVVVDYQLDDTTIYPVQVEVKESIEVPATSDFDAVTIPNVFSYGFGYRGACGSLLVSTDGIPKLIGVHIAGTKDELSQSKCGFSEPLTLDALKEVLSDIQHEMIYEEFEGIDPTLTFPPSLVTPCENVEIIGTVDKALCVNSPVISMKVKTGAFNEIWETKVCPAPLSPFNGIDPLKLALDKYSKIPKSFCPKLLSRCSQDIEELLITYSKPLLVTRKQWLTDKEIFEGIAQHKQYSGINLQTSEGYPLCMYKTVGQDVNLFHHCQKSGKHWLFDYEMDGSLRQYKGMHPQLRTLIRSNEALRCEGIVPLTIYITTLKDQTIEVEKALAGKNRIFSCAPVQNTWATKKYFGHWQAAYIASRFDNESAIGINPESSEWTLLAKRLLDKGNNIVTGDYSAFGDTLARDCMWEVYRIIEAWYKFYYGDQKDYEQCKKMRFMLFLEMCSGFHMAKNLIFRKVAGIPSGFALTVEINDLVNKLYIRMAFVKLTGRPVSDFRRFTYLCTYGDDLILSVVDGIKDEFNFRTIKFFLEEQNISFTPTTKDSTVYDFKDIYNSTFLKGHFVPHPIRHGIFMHRLPLISILESINWKNKSISDDRYLYSAFRDSLEGLHAYGKDTFNSYRDSIFRFVARNLDIVFPHSGKPDLPTWEDIDEYVYGDNRKLVLAKIGNPL